MTVAAEAGETDEDAKKRQKRGGKGVIKIFFLQLLYIWTRKIKNVQAKKLVQ